MFNPFTINRNYKTLQEMYISLLNEKERQQRQSIIWKQLYVQEAQDNRGYYEEALEQNGELLCKINKLEEVINQQSEILVMLVNGLVIPKIKKGGKVK